MDHKTFLAALPPAKRRELCRQKDAPGVLRFLVHVGCIFVLGSVIQSGVGWWWLALMPQGILLVFLFTALHETIHRTAFATPWVNDAVAWICSFAVLLPPNHFRYFHLAHHRHTHNPDLDPELEARKPATLREYAVYLSGIPEWRWRVANLMRSAVGTNADRYVPPRGRRRVQREAQVFLVIYAAGLVLFGEALLWTWIVPLLLGGPFLRVYLLAEHSFCPHVTDMFTNTRTTFTTLVVRWIAWNMPYHAEHHAYPAVPFHRLPALHDLVREHLQSTQDGYSRFSYTYLARAKVETGHAS